jgi:hypothetical protein
MSYELRIWDPTRHPSLPTDATDAADILERLQPLADTGNARLQAFGNALVERYRADTPESDEQGGLEAFWGIDPRQSTATCVTAVYPMSLPSDDNAKQVAIALDAAAQHGLVVIEDETGVCFLPDGTVFPEDAREMWDATRAALLAGPDANPAVGDSRTLLQKIAGELFDALGRGNKHQH